MTRILWWETKTYPYGRVTLCVTTGDTGWAFPTHLARTLYDTQMPMLLFVTQWLTHPDLIFFSLAEARNTKLIEDILLQEWQLLHC